MRSRLGCDSVNSFVLRQREQIYVFVRLLFALHLEERESAHWLACAARMQRAKCLADPAVLEGAPHGDQRVAGVIAERGCECDLLLRRSAGGGEVGRAEALLQL